MKIDATCTYESGFTQDEAELDKQMKYVEKFVKDYLRQGCKIYICTRIHVVDDQVS